MNELQSLPNKFVRNVEEEMVEDSANVIFGDHTSTPSLPKLSKKKRATPLYDRQPEKRKRTFPSPAAEESSDNRQVTSEMTSAIVPALLNALPQWVSNTGQSNLCPPPVKQDPLKIQHKGLHETQSLFEGISVIHLNTRSKKRHHDEMVALMCFVESSRAVIYLSKTPLTRLTTTIFFVNNSKI